MNGEPYEVLEANFSRMQQRKAVIQTKIRNLASNKIQEVTFQASDYFEKAEIEKRPLVFVYHRRGEFIFSDPGNSKNRLSIPEKIVAENKKWLKPATQVTVLFFQGRILNVNLPIKINFKVLEAPPGVQRDRATSGTKGVTIETGAVIQTPLFIKSGDVIRINTETGEYVERVEKVS